MSQPQVTLDQVLAVAPPEWEGTEHGRRSLAAVNSFHEWFRDIDQTTFQFWTGETLTKWTDWLRTRRQRLSPATVNRRVAAVLSVWRRAHRRGLLGPPPTGMYAREPKGRRRVLSPEEEPRLLEFLSPPYRSLARLLLASGLRVGEALALKWDDVRWIVGEGWSVTVRDSKNGDARTVPGIQRVACFNRQVPGLRDPKDDSIGPFSTVSHSAFNHAFRAAKAAIGLEKDDELVPHSLRHTYATRMVVAGVPLSVVARLLGHRTVRTTMRYSHVSDEDAARWVKKVQEGS
jgi:integrase